MKSNLLDKLKHAEWLYKLTNWIFEKLGIATEYSNDFKRLFFNREIGELYGFYNGNFWRIIFLYITLFISVGFGIQSKRYFNQQLDNPFVRFLSVPISGDAAACPGLIDELKSKYSTDSVKSIYHLDTVRAFSTNNPLRFSSSFVETTFTGMADDYNSALVLEAVCSKGNGFIGKPFNTIEERSAIVTLNLLKDLYLIDSDVSIQDLKENDIPGYIMFQPSGFGQSYPILIQGVTEQLPYDSDFLLPSKFNDYLFYDPSYIFYGKESDQVSFYIDKLLSVDDVKALINPIAEKYGVITTDDNILIESTSSIHSSLLISVRNVTDTLFSNAIRNAMISKFDLKDDQIVDAYFKPYDMNGSSYVYKASQSSMLVVFNDLNQVGPFNEDLKAYSSEVITNTLMPGAAKKIKGIEMEMEKIRLRFILNLIEIIVFSFMFIIGVLSVISLTTFIKVLFEKYFLKIEKNIGTFMAFGINIKDVYAILLTKFVITTVVISFVIAIGVGYFAEFLLLNTIGYSANDHISLFSINIWMLAALFVIILSNYVAFRRAARIFSKWPGDIINGR